MTCVIYALMYDVELFITILNIDRFLSESSQGSDMIIVGVLTWSASMIKSENWFVTWIAHS